MKTYKVKQGKHRFCPIQFGLYKNKTSISYKVIFDESCRYDIEDSDQEDINKLFGIGFLSFNWPPHHIDSARFGWSYNLEKGRIGIYSYYYLNGERKYDITKPICFCKPGVKYEFYLGISQDKYHFVVWREDNILSEGAESIPFTHNKKWSFLLSPYFGGNQLAPHPMTIYMEKK